MGAVSDDTPSKGRNESGSAACDAAAANASIEMRSESSGVATVEGRGGTVNGLSSKGRKQSGGTKGVPLRRAVGRSLGMGLACATVGAAVGGLVARDAVGEGYALFPLWAAAGGFGAGFGCWLWLVARRAQPRRGRGILAGALAGLLGHWCCWYLAIAWARLGYLVHGGNLGSLGEPPMPLFVGLAGAAIFSFWSLLIFGWLTIPGGALLGLLLSWFQQGPCKGGKGAPQDG